MGENIHPSQIRENLTIFVLSIQSFASNNKEGRKARRENENLTEHTASYTYNDKMLANADESSLFPAQSSNGDRREPQLRVLGRVLRLPYTRKQPDELLNLSYVFTCQADFQDTPKRIVESLNNAGFSKRDFRVANNCYEEDDAKEQQEEYSLFSNPLFTNTPSESTPNTDDYKENLQKDTEDDIADIKPEVIKHCIESSDSDGNARNLEDSALKQSGDYNTLIEENDGECNDSIALMTNMNNTYSIKPIFADIAKEIKLPVFVLKLDAGLFSDEITYSPIEKSDLLKGLDLSVEDHKIDFTRSAVEMGQIDQVSDNPDDSDSVPIHKQLNTRQIEIIKQHLLASSPESKKQQLASTITRRLNIQEVSDRMVEDYIFDCIKNFDNDTIDELITYQMQTVETVRNKLNSIFDSYRHKTFKDWLDTGKIKLGKDNMYSFPKCITVITKMIGVQKGLYREEDSVNVFESKVISVIANNDNVVLWHRNQERGKGYFINGFLNHYPDFIVKLKTGQTLLIEAKGDDRDNSDSARKLELGKTWANAAGDNYRYYMVFDNKAMEGTITLKEQINKIGDFANNA